MSICRGGRLWTLRSGREKRSRCWWTRAGYARAAWWRAAGVGTPRARNTWSIPRSARAKRVRVNLAMVECIARFHHLPYRSQRSQSLGALAPAATGTRWNGPLCFGLVRRRTRDRRLPPAEERERTVKSGSRQNPAGVVVGELLPAAKRASMETVGDSREGRKRVDGASHSRGDGAAGRGCR